MSPVLAVFIGNRLCTSIQVQGKCMLKQDFELLDKFWTILTIEMSLEIGTSPKRPNDCPLELTSNMIIGVDFLEGADEMLEWEAPPGHDRTEKDNEVIDVKCGMDVGSGIMFICVGVNRSRFFHPLFEEEAEGFSTILRQSISADQDDSLE
jgi:hypothetical protein